MIPYVHWETIPFGSLTIYVWGLFAAIGFLAGFWVAARELQRRSQLLDPEQRRRATNVIWDLAPWIVLSALLGSRLYAVFLDSPGYYVTHPSEMLAIWTGGLSVFGGIFGAALATIVLLKRRKILTWSVVDSLAFALPLGIGIGRIGCFFIHDHLGTLTTMPWGVRFPDGLIRHDLGLELALFDLALFGSFLLARWWHSAIRHSEQSRGISIHSHGFYVFTFLIAKSLARLWLDFYRIWDGPLAEPRYGMLTATQYVAILMLFIVGCFLLQYRFRTGEKIE